MFFFVSFSKANTRKKVAFQIFFSFHQIFQAPNGGILPLTVVDGIKLSTLLKVFRVGGGSQMMKMCVYFWWWLAHLRILVAKKASLFFQPMAVYMKKKYKTPFGSCKIWYKEKNLRKLFFFSLCLVQRKSQRRKILRKVWWKNCQKQVTKFSS